jgi:DNA-binding IscR family transcriptional regulator
MTNSTASRTALQPDGAHQPSWSFLTNYAIVLVYVALHPDSTVRTIASDVGITERAALSILRDLYDEGIVQRTRNGRRNTYAVDFSRLASMRRGGRDSTNPLTPRIFVDVVIKMLFDIAHQRDESAPHSPPHAAADQESESRAGSWGFFTNHLLILLAVAGDGSQTVRELAVKAEITERAAVAILNQLRAENIVEASREGRRNSYTIDFDAFRNFRGWSFETWSMPPQLVAVAADGILMLARKAP